MALLEKITRRLASWRRRKHKAQPRARLVVEPLESRVLMDVAGFLDNGLTVNIPEEKIVRFPDPVDASRLTLPNTGPSLRLGSYNGQFLPAWLTGDGFVTGLLTDGGIKPTGFDDIPDRARKVADLILASDYDVIALSEVFDLEAFDDLVSRLGVEYPHQVRFVGGAPGRHPPESPSWEDLRDSLAGQNSGLMLFSRFPFAEFPEDIPAAFLPAPADVSAVSNGESWADVAFTEYTRCHGWLGHASDCFGRKGAAMVRIRNPFSGDFYNVVFTHLEAGQVDVERDIRRSQLEQVRDMISGVLTETQLDSEAVLVLGDFNIHGQRSADGTHPEEWQERFDVGAAGIGGFFSPPAGDDGLEHRLHDVWEFDTQHPLVLSDFPDKVDPGITHDTRGTSEKRIDYIFSNFADDGRFSVQHLYRSWNMWDGEPFRAPGMGRGGRQPLSDHWGLTVEINRRAPRSSPEDAAVLSEDAMAEPGAPTCMPSGDFETCLYDADNTAVIDGTLANPGSFQWYLITEPGTYTIAIDGNEKVDFRIYKSSNLSEPYQGTGYRGQIRELTYTEWVTIGGGSRSGGLDGGSSDGITVPRPRTLTGRKYGLTEPPFYIRVFGIDDAGNQDRTVAGSYKLIVHKHQGATMDDAIILLPNQRVEPMRFPVDWPMRYFQIDTEGPDSGLAQTLSFFLDPSDLNAYRLEMLDELGAPFREEVVYGEPTVAKIELHEAGFNWRQFYMRATVFAESHVRTAEFLPWWTTNLFVLQPQSIYVNQQVNRPPIWRNDNNVRLRGGIETSAGRIDLPTQRFGELDQKNYRAVDWGPVRLLAGDGLDLRVAVDADPRGPLGRGRLALRTKHLDGRIYEGNLPDTDASASTSFTEEVVEEDGPWQANVRLERDFSCGGPVIRKCGFYTFNSRVSHWLYQEGVPPGVRMPLSGEAAGSAESALLGPSLAAPKLVAPKLVAPEFPDTSAALESPRDAASLVGSFAWLPPADFTSGSVQGNPGPGPFGPTLPPDFSDAPGGPGLFIPDNPDFGDGPCGRAAARLWREYVDRFGDTPIGVSPAHLEYLQTRAEICRRRGVPKYSEFEGEARARAQETYALWILLGHSEDEALAAGRKAGRRR